MPLSDALVVGEDWISAHSFTADANSESFRAKVLERRKSLLLDNHRQLSSGPPPAPARASVRRHEC